MEKLLKNIIEDFLKEDFKELVLAKKKNDRDSLLRWWGRAMGKIELLPDVLIRHHKYEKPNCSIGLALAHLWSFVDYTFSSLLKDKPEYYDYIMEVVNED